MRNRTHPELLLLVFVAVLAGCDGGRRSGPNGPSTTQQTYTLSGAVSEITADGSAPIVGARVMDMSFGRAVLTDANGSYSIPGLPATSHSVSVSKEGYVTETKALTMSSDTQLDIRLERNAYYSLSGVVFEMTAEGRVPIEGVQVYCDSCGSPDGHTFVSTDANGSYSLAWTANGSHTLYVTKAGYRIFDPAPAAQDMINATVRGDTRFDIQLVRR